MANADIPVPVRFELTNYYELLSIYHALGEILMAANAGEFSARIQRSDPNPIAVESVMDQWKRKACDGDR